MDTHPVTITIGIIGAIVLFVLVGLGFSCMLYKANPDEYPYLKIYYEYSKNRKIC
jgi:hypothetical protein